MSLTDAEKKSIRDAMYVAGIGADETFASALGQLNSMIIEDKYPEWSNYQVIDMAIGRSPGYQAAWDALLRELKAAPPIGVPNPTPEPVPSEDSYPHVPDDPDEFAQAVLAVLRARGLYIEDGCFGFGGIDPLSASTVQVFGNRYVNEGSIQYGSRDPSIVSTGALSGDRGFRQMNNYRITKEGVDAYDPDGGVHFTRHFDVVDKSRISSKIGTDSRHQLSVERTDPKYPHEYTQDAVLVIDEDSKTISWQSWRKGWSWALVTDGKYGPARIWRAITELWG